MNIDPTALAKIYRARANGIVSPLNAWRASRQVGLPYWAACSLLMQESYGGENVWGSDDSQFRGYPETPDASNFAVYRWQRKQGMGMQGCGPCQLTWWELQDKADELGGCWQPYPNMVVGFGILASDFDAHGDWWMAARLYNGSGPAAEAYADRMVERFAEWRLILNG